MTFNPNKVVDDIIHREGDDKFTNDPNDPGGATKFGVTAVKLGEWRRLGRPATPEEVRNLQRPEAVALFLDDFINKPGFALVATVSPAIAEELTDTGVNMGVSTPGPWLQRILNSLNNGGAYWPDVVVDGKIGGRTVEALRSLRKMRGDALSDQLVLTGLNAFQYVRYVELCEKRSGNEEYQFGWLKARVLGL